MSAKKNIVKELDDVLASVRRAEQNIIGMDASDKISIVEKLVALEDTIKSIQSGIDVPNLTITADTEVYTLQEDEILSVRSTSILMRSGCKNISDIITHTGQEIQQMRHMGAKSYQEIVDFLHDNGFKLKGEE